MTLPENSDAVLDDLESILAAAGVEPLTSESRLRFVKYLDLILRWNTRMNLTAIRDPHEILQRHFVESIICARLLPEGIRSLLDFGTGAGFPGIPIAVCRPDILVTLAESQSKKAAFLQEAVRVLELKAAVFAGRAENLAERFDCVTMRAVDRMNLALALAAALVRPGGWLVAMTTLDEFTAAEVSVGPGFSWDKPRHLPGSDQRVIAVSSKDL